MPTTTTNLGLKVPVVGSDTNNWGGYLNDDLGYLDNMFTVTGTSVSLFINNQNISSSRSPYSSIIKIYQAVASPWIRLD